MKARTDQRQRQGGPATPPEGWRFKVIGYVALFAGVAGGLFAWFNKGPAVSGLNMGLGLPMLIAPYLVVPRTRSRRILQGTLSGALSGIVSAAVLLFFATGTYAPLWREMGAVFVEYLVGAVGTSWLSSVVTKWTDKLAEKKRAEAAQKRAQELAEKYKDRYRVNSEGRLVRVHQKKRKKR